MAISLPEQFNKKETNTLSFGPKKIIIGMETDLTGGGKGTSTTPELLNEYGYIRIPWPLRGSSRSFIDGDTFKVSNVEVPRIPPQLVGVIDSDKKFTIYVNGVNIPAPKWSSEVSGSDLYINFNTGSLSEGGVYPTDLLSTTSSLGYILENTDEFGITGKFIEL